MGVMMMGASQRSRKSGRVVRVFACCLMLHASWPVVLYAQPAPPTNASPASAAQAFNTEQLDALLAPIALYPDPLLTQILMASTYPLQIVQAGRWAEEPANKALTGDALTKALEAQPWDPSVKSLVPFPQVLATMNGNLDWTQQLGTRSRTSRPPCWTRCKDCGVRRRAMAACSRRRSRWCVRSNRPSSSNPHSRMLSMCPATIRPRYTVPGRTRRIRRSIYRHRLAILSARHSPPASHSVSGWRSPPDCGIGRRLGGALAMSM